MNHFIYTLLEITVILLGYYLISYAKERAKNRAQKQDIKEITDKIESIKIEYSSELERIKSELQKNNQVAFSSLTSFITAHQAFLDYKGKAFISIWEKLSEVRKLMNPIIIFIDMLNIRSNENSRSQNAHINLTLENLKEISITDFANFFNAINEQRIFIDENLWNELKIYYYFYINIYMRIEKALKIKDDTKKFAFKWHEDKEIQKYINQLIPDEFDQVIHYNGPGHLQFTVNRLENRLIREISNVISGKSAAETTLEINTSILKLQRDQLMSQDKDILPL